MANDSDPWQHGRWAWERLDRWREAPSDGGLAALFDVGLVRRLLDQAELAAVKAARSDGASWAEIATKLGVSRQSAWERWRDVDPQGDVPAEVVERAAAERVAQKAGMAAEIVVPDVVGMNADDARRLLHDLKLRAFCVPESMPSGVVAEQLRRQVS